MLERLSIITISGALICVSFEKETEILLHIFEGKFIVFSCI